MIITETRSKVICLIGYTESSLSQEGFSHLKRAGWTGGSIMISPEEFLELKDKTLYQYFVMFSLDIKLRERVIQVIEDEELDCLSYIDPDANIYTDLSVMPAKEAFKIIGRGSGIGAFSTVMMDSKIGNHCIVETYCLLSHFSELGNNVLLHSGTMIAGKTTVVNNCVFNFKSSALNKLSICDNVEIGALSNVTKDIIKPGRYVGSIARYVGERISDV